MIVCQLLTIGLSRWFDIRYVIGQQLHGDCLACETCLLMVFFVALELDSYRRQTSNEFRNEIQQQKNNGKGEHLQLLKLNRTS